MKTRLRHNFKAFTLTEILVAMGLAAFILIAVGAVFKTSSDTVGTGYALSEAYRSLRATQTTLYNNLVGYDLTGGTTGIVPAASSPFLLVHSEQVTASLNGVDKTNGNTENYRTDILSFFSQGTFLRQTGQNNNGFISDMSVMNNAYVWLGHVNQYNNALTTSNLPGTATWPDNNSYADTFCLGQVVIPMAAATQSGTNYYIWSTNNNQQVYLNSNSDTDLSPFAWNSTLGTNGSASLGMFFSSTLANPPELFDMASFPFNSTHGYAASLGGYRSKVKALQTANGTNWWQPLMLVNGNGGFHRFDAYPFIVGPASPASMSMMVPRLQEGCTQFVVEFAGDFVKQNAAGGVTGVGQDGQIDFYLDPSGNKRIQWYGFPRSIYGSSAAPSSPHPSDGNVYPVSSVAGTAALPFEKEIPGAHYTCAFGPVEFDNNTVSDTTDGYATYTTAVKPSLIRILVTVTDKNNRLPNGVTQEYIFKVP